VAYHYFRKGASTGRVFREFNIDFSVGPGGVDLPDDVMLVQMLLRIVYVENQLLPPMAGQKELKVTGKSSDQLMYSYILHFKTQLLKRGQDIYPDKVLDPLRDNNPDMVGTLSRKRYAFSYLQNLCSGQAPERFNSFPEDPTTPDILVSALNQTRKTARQYKFDD
jgi:hypothetical protein